jgi:hypothetical protein
LEGVRRLHRRPHVTFRHWCTESRSPACISSAGACLGVRISADCRR